MVQMPDICQKQYRKAIFIQDNSRFVKFLVLPILATTLYLALARATSAQQTPKPVVEAGKETSGQSNSLPPRRVLQPAKPSSPRLVSSGNQISLNGRILPGAWLQQPKTAGNVSIHLSDGAVRQLIGADLLNSGNPGKQPIQWFSSVKKPLVLASLLQQGYRYLDITNFAKTAGWQFQVNGKTLLISTPKARVADIRQSKQPAGEQIIVDLDRPTPWQVTQEASVKKPQPLPPPVDPLTPIPKPAPPNKEWTITLDGAVDPLLIQRFAPPPLTPPTVDNVDNTVDNPQPLIKQVEVVNNQTILRLSIPPGLSPQVSTLPNPNRLVIDVRPDAIAPRDIVWAPGLRWRQQFVNLGKERFPVVWLEVNQRAFGLTLKPIWANPDTLVGTAPLIQTAQRHLALAAINGGYFNRNNRLPLGAIRGDGQWLSSPILNRGAIAWNDSGQFHIGRLTLQETLTTPQGRLPILFLNSGYIQAGIARYTPVWGATYTPLTDNETIIVVQNNQVINQLPGGKVGQTAVPIPQDGYLLTLRGNAAASANQLPIGSQIRIESATLPADFNRYPYIVGAGPLLVQNRQIVLDAKSEKFSDAFIAEKAVRSAICTNAAGTLIIAAVHNRAGGAGPTLAEHAQLMQQMGCVDALNLDGGSSTSLYLGGQLLNRSPSTAARVHNGIGIFLQPLRAVKNPQSKVQSK